MPQTDAELLAAARTDPQAFREFYDRYAVWVRSWFQRQTRSETAALDLTAETFAQAWRSVKRFRDEADGSGAPWLFGIARNLLRQYHKHNRIETAAREPAGAAAGVRRVRGLRARRRADGGVDDGAGAARRGRGAARPQRRALELRVVQQLSYDEVAGRLGCSQNAARLRVSRALRTLTLALGRRRGSAG